MVLKSIFKKYIKFKLRLREPQPPGKAAGQFDCMPSHAGAWNEKKSTATLKLHIKKNQKKLLPAV